jgi:hypothetical protein
MKYALSSLLLSVSLILGDSSRIYSAPCDCLSPANGTFYTFEEVANWVLNCDILLTCCCYYNTFGEPRSGGEGSGFVNACACSPPADHEGCIMEVLWTEVDATGHKSTDSKFPDPITVTKIWTRVENVSCVGCDHHSDRQCVLRSGPASVISPSCESCYEE